MSPITGLGPVGVVGCGAAAQLNHLPALSRLGIHPSVVVDSNGHRARTVAANFGVRRYCSDIREAYDHMDCAIVATPPDSHASLARELLREGIHVFVEKPLATTPDDARRILQTAVTVNRHVGVGLMRRYWHATRWLDSFLKAGAGSTVQFFDIREGFAFEWPAVTDYFLRSGPLGNGTLPDIGSHVLDLVLLWFGAVTRISYFDDSHGGPEADCELFLRMKSGAAGFIELSRTRHLRGSALLYGDGWSIQVPDLYRNSLRARPARVLHERFHGLRGDALPPQSLSDLYVAQLLDFFTSVVTGRHESVPAADSIRVLEVISWCYENRRPLAHSWTPPQLLPDSF